MAQGKICSRSIDAGPGSCRYWWETCPDKVRHCFSRFVRANGGTIERDQAEHWAAARDKDQEPEPTLI